MDLRLTREDFDDARRTIAGLVHRTPMFSSRSLSERTGLRAWLKAENFQKTGSFKVRGAFNMVLHLSPVNRARGIVTASAGNHGQAVAYVASHQRIPGYVVMPERANPSKVSAVREYGAEAILHGRLWDDAYARSRELAEEKGLVYVHPFKDRHIMAGQGTIGLEIAEDLSDLDAVLIPIGGGGLIAGIAMALRVTHPNVRIIGVEPEGSANMYTSRRDGAATDLREVATIADGLATRATDPDVFRCIEQTVDDLVVVTDDEIRRAIPFLMERAKLVAEPAGAATVAALLGGKISLPDKSRTVALVSGGNLDVRGSVTLSL
jgi:threonine dehydratase